MKDELGGKIITKFVRLTAQTNSYSIDGHRQMVKIKKEKVQKSVS